MVLPVQFGDADDNRRHPIPYVITSGTVISTDPSITTNGRIDFGKIYRDPAQRRGALSAFYSLGPTSTFDTASGFRFPKLHRRRDGRRCLQVYFTPADWRPDDFHCRWSQINLGTDRRETALLRGGSGRGASLLLEFRGLTARDTKRFDEI